MTTGCFGQSGDATTLARRGEGRLPCNAGVAGNTGLRDDFLRPRPDPAATSRRIRRTSPTASDEASRADRGLHGTALCRLVRVALLHYGRQRPRTLDPPVRPRTGPSSDGGQLATPTSSSSARRRGPARARCTLVGGSSADTRRCASSDNVSAPRAWARTSRISELSGAAQAARPRTARADAGASVEQRVDRGAARGRSRARRRRCRPRDRPSRRVAADVLSCSSGPGAASSRTAPPSRSAWPPARRGAAARRRAARRSARRCCAPCPPGCARRASPCATRWSARPDGARRARGRCRGRTRAPRRCRRGAAAASTRGCPSSR